MAKKYKILIMGASYGSLLGTKLAMAGHSTHLICLPAEADLMNAEGAIVPDRNSLQLFAEKLMPAISAAAARYRFA